MYHPRDTMALWKSLDKNLVDNIWYKMHYFQQKNTNSRLHERCHRLQRSILPTSEGQKSVDQYLQIRLECFCELQKTHVMRIYEGNLEEIVLPGLGSHHVRESSLTLHPLFGVPYIPASSLKGVVRNWAVQAFASGNEQQMEEGEDLSAKYFRAIFGTQKQCGRVQFYDVFFEDGYEIVPDVLTVHFREYYGGRKSPTDDQSPNPVSFYGVKGQIARVYFTVALHEDNLESLAEVVGEWTTKALCELGIGSKTASGYGRFMSLTDVTEAVLGDLLEAKRLEREEQAQALAEEKRRRELEAYLAKLSVGQQLAYEIGGLSIEQADSDRSKSTMYEEMLNLPFEERQIVAQALKEYWERTGDWKKPSKRQKEKNQVIRKLLDNA